MCGAIHFTIRPKSFLDSKSNIMLYSTKILTADDMHTKRKRGKGRQGESNPKKTKKKIKDNAETGDESNWLFKDSTLSTSSLIESEDSEWVDPFEENRMTQDHMPKKIIRKPPVKKRKPKGKKRVTKERRKTNNKSRNTARGRKSLDRLVKRAKF